MPTISIDYGFLGKEGTVARESIGSTVLPIIIVKDRKSRGIWAIPTWTKGTVNPHASAAIVRVLDSTGYKRIILKSDQENAMRALQTQAKIKCGGESVPMVFAGVKSFRKSL